MGQQQKEEIEKGMERGKGREDKNESGDSDEMKRLKLKHSKTEANTDNNRDIPQRVAECIAKGGDNEGDRDISSTRLLLRRFIRTLLNKGFSLPSKDIEALCDSAILGDSVAQYMSKSALLRVRCQVE